MQTRWALLVAVALAWSPLVRAAPIAYTLTVVAKTGDTIDGKTLTGFKQPSFGGSSPAINADGRVAFYAPYSEGAFVGEGIFTPTALVVKNVDLGSTTAFAPWPPSREYSDEWSHRQSG